jgi:hypothetical protein
MTRKKVASELHLDCNSLRVLAEDLRRAHQAGFNRHLAKPPSLEQLDQLVAEVPACDFPC